MHYSRHSLTLEHLDIESYLSSIYNMFREPNDTDTRETQGAADLLKVDLVAEEVYMLFSQ